MARSRLVSLRACALLAAPWVSACVDKAPPAPAVDPAMVADNLLSVPPTDLTRELDVDLGGKVTYLGYTTSQQHIAPGDKVSITHYWRVDHPPGKNYRVFSHLVGSGSDFVNVDQTDMRKGHPVEKWVAGQIIRDPQTFILRKDWRSPQATLMVGLYKKGGHTIADRLAVSGPNSKDNAAVVITFDVDVSQAAPLPGTVVLHEAPGPIVIDGKADDPGWAGAATAALVTAEGGPDVKGATSAQLTWDDRYLYAFISSQDSDVWSEYTKNDDPIWKSDVVELFIDADGNQRGYCELQVSPKNVHFDSWFAGGRAPAGDLGFDAQLQSAVNVRGTLDNRDDDDDGWDAEIAIPLASVKGLDPNMAVRIPPQPGDTWHLNVVRVDYPRGEKPAAASWNRIRYSDFHSLDRMLVVQFAGPVGAAAGVAPVAPAGAVVPPAGAAVPPAGAVVPPAGAVVPPAG
ncbi:MAG TPA: carbohydrate-binding family 9-like protein, partial [Kofleriaceae bacterium]|nr:carbohydrate-binding family 9-like protein [Kofleriaceae bacterium]